MALNVSTEEHEELAGNVLISHIKTYLQLLDIEDFVEKEGTWLREYARKVFDVDLTDEDLLEVGDWVELANVRISIDWDHVELEEDE